MASGTMRLLAVLELLQARREMTGAEIAEQLEVDPRSVRRYIKALKEMGIPIEGERGRYGAYRLNRGFKLPPLMFSEDEAVALTLGLMAIRALQFPIAGASIAGALAKVERVLPQALLDRTLALQEGLHVNFLLPATEIQSSVVTTLLTAIQCGQAVRMQYRSWKEELTERFVEPYGIVFYEGWWYLAGYCRLRRDVRTFRIDRIQQVEPGAGAFVRPTNVDVVELVRRGLNEPAGIAAVEVLFQTTLERARAAIPEGLGTFEEVAEGVLFRRPAYRLEWIAPILLSVDFPIRIIQPPELKTVMRALAEKALRMTADGVTG